MLKVKRIAFIQTIPIESIGVQSLAAALKGHELQVFIYFIDGYERIFKKLKKFNPEIICFSICTGDHLILTELAAKLKEIFKVPYIWGGPHATFFPEIIKEKGVDIVVRGEAEHLLPRIIDNPEDTKVESCYFKNSKGEIIKNEMGRVVQDPDSLNFPDRALYRKYYKTLPYSSLNIVAGRGCPFNCSFCYNQILKKLYEADSCSGKYVRLRSPENVIEEIKEYIKTYGKPKFVHFRDDTFIYNRKWVEDFFALYLKEINLPYTCLGRADLIDEGLAQILKKTKIAIFFWAIETGSENLRNSLLKKNISDEKIIRCGDILNKYKIKFRTYNMMGLPTETFEDALLTVKINQRIKNPYPLVTLYDPYPETELAKVAAEKNLLKQDINTFSYSANQYTDSMVIVDERVLRVQKLFYYFVRFPSLEFILKKWVNKEHKIINGILFYMAYGYVFYRTYKYTITEMFLIIWRSFFYLVGGRKRQLPKENKESAANSIN